MSFTLHELVYALRTVPCGLYKEPIKLELSVKELIEGKRARRKRGPKVPFHIEITINKSGDKRRKLKTYEETNYSYMVIGSLEYKQVVTHQIRLATIIQPLKIY